MRELEYRAWDRKNKRWINNEVIYITSKGEPFQLGCIDESYTKKRIFILQMLDEIDVLQYTGLKDNNGKKIFEGDIVYLFGLKDSLFEIINHKSCFGYFITGNFVPLCGYHLHPDVIEIIGNIYENPELLEG